MAIAGTTTLATARGIQRRTLNNASLALQADIRRAQRLSLIEGRRWRVQFDQQNNRYFLHSIPRFEADYIYEVYLPRGVEFAVLGRPFTEFLPRGTVGGGGFGQGTAFTIRLRNGRFEQDLTIVPSSGRVRVFEIQRI